jgi:hypothetical protein
MEGDPTGAGQADWGWVGGWGGWGGGGPGPRVGGSCSSALLPGDATLAGPKFAAPVASRSTHHLEEALLERAQHGVCHCEERPGQAPHAGLLFKLGEAAGQQGGTAAGWWSMLRHCCGAAQRHSAMVHRGPRWLLGKLLAGWSWQEVRSQQGTSDSRLSSIFMRHGRGTCQRTFLAPPQQRTALLRRPSNFQVCQEEAPSYSQGHDEAAGGQHGQKRESGAHADRGQVHLMTSCRRLRRHGCTSLQQPSPGAACSRCEGPDCQRLQKVAGIELCCRISLAVLLPLGPAVESASR